MAAIEATPASTHHVSSDSTWPAAATRRTWRRSVATGVWLEHRRVYLGQPYALAVRFGSGESVDLIGDRFELSMSRRASGRSLMRAWYLDQARSCLGPRIATLAAEMGVAYRRICVRDLRYRWGSCSQKGTLTFNWRIVQAPMIVVSYLIVHELAHVRELSHSPEFWNLVAVHAPRWSAARNWLKRNGAGLEW